VPPVVMCKPGPAWGPDLAHLAYRLVPGRSRIEPI
jgi:hypothetical protein